MNRTAKWLLSLFALAVTAGQATPAQADGMVSYHVEVADAQTLPVQATAQRAILWYRTGASEGEDGWRIIIQPKFDRVAGAAAWIVPFPEVPTVTQASAELFDAMETLTSPVFIPFCYEEEDSDGWFGCAGSAKSGDGGLSRTAPALSGVHVWGSGVTDQLEYVILSATGAAELIKWLEEQDFRVPDGLKNNPGLVEGKYIFAGKLLAGQDPKKPLAPISFGLPGLAYDKIAYPMKLTSLVAPADGMELVLWVVTPGTDAFLVPSELDWLVVLGSNRLSKSQWEENINKLRAAFPPRGGLVMEYSDAFQSHPYLQEYPYIEMPVWSAEGQSLEDLGIVTPEQWPAEVTGIGSDGYRVVRWSGRVRADGMKEDLGFKVQEMVEGNQYRGNIYFEELPCSEIPDEELAQALESRTATHGMALLAVFCLLIVAAARFRKVR